MKVQKLEPDQVVVRPRADGHVQILIEAAEVDKDTLFLFTLGDRIPRQGRMVSHRSWTPDDIDKAINDPDDGAGTTGDIEEQPDAAGAEDLAPLLGSSAGARPVLDLANLDQAIDRLNKVIDRLAAPSSLEPRLYTLDQELGMLVPVIYPDGPDIAPYDAAAGVLLWDPGLKKGRGVTVCAEVLIAPGWV